MQTECTAAPFSLQPHAKRSVTAAFDGGHVSSDGGALLLRKALDAMGVSSRVAACFTDERNPLYTEFSVDELVRQRLVGLMLGYEDLNDHDRLRVDPLLALAVGRADILGHDRRQAVDRGKPLAGKSTLNRLELSAETATRNKRYHKIVVDPAKLDALLINEFIREHERAPSELWLDLDTTNIDLHGEQEGKHFSAYYDAYCYTPLYVMCGDFPLLARIRSASIGPTKDVVEHLRPVVERLREQWPDVRIVIRADSGFCCEDLMHYCEQNGLLYLMGLATNPRLTAMVANEMQALAAQAVPGHEVPPRDFKSFDYQTLNSWTRVREVVARLEWAGTKPNARFVVTNLPSDVISCDDLYERDYCQRALMENHIKEHQLDLFADRMSTQVIAANQLRLMFSTFAFLVMRYIRKYLLAGTTLARATTGTVRNRLLKIGAIVRVSVRRITVSLSAAFPLASILREAAIDPPPGPPRPR